MLRDKIEKGFIDTIDSDLEKMKNWVCWGGVHRKSNQYEGRTKLKQWVWYWLCWLRLWRCIVGSEYVSGETYLEIINTPVAIGMAEMVHGEWAEEQQSSSKIGLRKTSNEGWMTEWNKMRNLLTPLIKRKLYSWDTVLKQMKRRRTGKIISNVGKRFIRNFCQLRKRLNTSAKSLQSFPTLCDPMDCSPPGSPIPGILQARALEWVAISFSSAWKWKMKVKSLSCVRLLATPWTAAYQAPPSMGFSWQEYWSGVPLPSPIIPKKNGQRVWKDSSQNRKGKCLLNIGKEFQPHSWEMQHEIRKCYLEHFLLKNVNTEFGGYNSLPHILLVNIEYRIYFYVQFLWRPIGYIN